MGGVFRFLTAGESHGEALTAVIDGVPAGLPLTEADINGDLARRQRGYGRGGCMKIERDQVHVLSGVRWGATLGSPITLSIANRDWENWKATMGVAVPEAGTATPMVAFQFSQSRLAMLSVMGEPSVAPQRTPDRTWTWSRSIFMRPPRP